MLHEISHSSTVIFTHLFIFSFVCHPIFAQHYVCHRVLAQGSASETGTLPLEFVRAVDETTLAENQLCEGFYNDNKEWYDCILLQIDKGKFSPSRCLLKKRQMCFVFRQVNECAGKQLAGRNRKTRIEEKRSCQNVKGL